MGAMVRLIDDRNTFNPERIAARAP